MLIRIDLLWKRLVSTEPQINRYFTAKRREASRLYETANCRDAIAKRL
ncbi:MAG: hypothetical protein VSS75_024610 [Candidatus Parabeggiatoa sp.]|nr:hypothetical protein [Candidatus Parabeggiatoa sp.]